MDFCKPSANKASQIHTTKAKYTNKVTYKCRPNITKQAKYAKQATFRQSRSNTNRVCKVQIKHAECKLRPRTYM